MGARKCLTAPHGRMPGAHLIFLPCLWLWGADDVGSTSTKHYLKANSTSCPFLVREMESWGPPARRPPSCRIPSTGEASPLSPRNAFPTLLSLLPPFFFFRPAGEQGPG